MNKKTVIVFGILVTLSVLFLGFRLYQAQQVRQTAIAGDNEVIVSKDFGVSFTYPKGENGFSLIEPDGKDKGILKSYILMPTKEFEIYKQSTNSEAPASISLFVFPLDTSTDESTSTSRETRITQLQNWADENNTFTSINSAKSTPEVIETDGVKGLRYQADGLYQQDVYLLAYKAKVYMFVGQYDKDTDMTYTEFQDLLKTVAFD